MTPLQLNLFEEMPPRVYTEGVKYVGSKLKLIPNILAITEELKPKTIWDGFSGTTRVSQAFAQTGYKVVSSDVSVWSEVFAKCYLQCPKPRDYFKELFDYLNSLRPCHGWFTEWYGSEKSFDDGGLKCPWQKKNTMKLDAIRNEIDKLSLSDVDKAVALTGLILALDRVDNTLGHYASYLRNWSTRSYNDLVLEIPHYQPYLENEHIVLKGDVFDLAPSIRVDMAYFDPPYGSNNEKMPPSRVRYAAYYHLWKTVCLNDQPNLFGKANRRIDSKDTNNPSLFESYKKDKNGQYVAINAIKQMIEATKARWIVLSYSSGGRATSEELQSILNDNGNLIKTVVIDYKRNVMANMRWTNEWIKEAKVPNKEFLFVMEK